MSRYVSKPTLHPQNLSTRLGEFEFIDRPSPTEYQSTSPYDWKPPYWEDYPLKEDYVEPLTPWQRPAQASFAFVGVAVIDAGRGVVLPDMTVKIAGGRFTSVERSRREDMQEDGWISVDAKGLYMCPGLIDCHAHIVAIAEEHTTIYSDPETALRTAYILKGHLYNGFTTLRDVGGATRHYREATEIWLTPGPRLFIGGPVLSQTGGHGDHSNRDAPATTGGISDPDLRIALNVDGVDACLKVTRKLMMAGADHVKICSSGGVLSPTDKLETEQFTIPEIKAVCDTVRMMGGTLVTAHCFTSKGARNAIEGGIGGIEHGNLIDKETFQLMAKKGIHYTPTLIVGDSITRPPLSKSIPPFSLEKAKVIAKKGSEALVMAHEAGVNVAFGTDVGPNIQLAEFDLRKAVLPSKVVLKQATVNSARVVGQEGKLGVIKVGAFADFLLLGANPLEDVGILNQPNTYLRAVVKDGRCVRSTVEGLNVEVALV